MNQNLELKNGLFYASKESPCPYLPNQLEKKIVTEIAGEEAVLVYNMLSRCGFRRSNNICYTQICSNCSECIPIRVDVSNFAIKRSFRRILLKNQDVSYVVKEAKATDEQFAIFQKYQNSRHQGSEMAKMTFEEYRQTIEDSPVNTKIIEFRNSDNRFYALCICDILDDGLSAVYLFFDPEFKRQSLGTFAILAMIKETALMNLKYLYLGFWIPKCAKMSYKSKFKPFETLTTKGWKAF